MSASMVVTWWIVALSAVDDVQGIIIMVPHTIARSLFLVCLQIRYVSIKGQAKGIITFSVRSVDILDHIHAEAENNE